MPLVYQKFVRRSDLRANPTTLYVFGDNLLGRGLGGQAKHMRGEPNAVGIPTKRAPHMRADAYLSDNDPHKDFQIAILRIGTLRRHLQSGGKVVWPKDGIGTGLADLARRAPGYWDWLEARRKEFEQL